jgi:hypothetical protein
VKAFIDSTLPLGAGEGVVTYQVTAVRSTKTGMPGQVTVNFGSAQGRSGNRVKGLGDGGIARKAA